jgi:hypothetical protein
VLGADVVRLLKSEFDSEVTLLHAVGEDETEAEAEAFLEEWAAENGLEDAERVVDDRSGDTAIAAAAEDATLLVIGATERGLLSRLVRGSLVFDVVDDLDLDGVIAINTTTERAETLKNPNAAEEGGLSGKPIEQRGTQTVQFVAERTDVPVIGVGGISSAEGAYEKIRAGASVVQLYTGLVYEGPGIARKINEGLLNLLDRDGFDSVEDAVGADL